MSDRDLGQCRCGSPLTDVAPGGVIVCSLTDRMPNECNRNDPEGRLRDLQIQRMVNEGREPYIVQEINEERRRAVHAVRLKVRRGYRYTYDAIQEMAGKKP